MRIEWIGAAGLLLLTLAGCGPRLAPQPRDSSAPREEWPTYGNDPGSSRYSPLTEITKGTVPDLQVAWTYHTGDVARAASTWQGQKVWAKSTFEATQLVRGHALRGEFVQPDHRPGSGDRP